MDRRYWFFGPSTDFGPSTVRTGGPNISDYYHDHFQAETLSIGENFDPMTFLQTTFDVLLVPDLFQSS